MKIHVLKTIALMGVVLSWSAEAAQPIVVGTVPPFATTSDRAAADAIVSNDDTVMDPDPVTVGLDPRGAMAMFAGPGSRRRAAPRRDRTSAGQPSFKTLLAALAHGVNRAFPKAKSLLPKPLHRFVLLRLLGANEPYEKMLRENPERLFLQHEALPWVRDTYRKVLFVGTASYTHQYEEFFRDDPDRYTTIDRNPATKVWGGKHHIVASILDIDKHRPPGFFDCIVLNGILAYSIPELDDHGVIEREEIRKLVEALHKVLRPGGFLLVGWRLTDMPTSPVELGLLDPYFALTERPPWGKRKEFPGDIHVLESYERQAV